MTSDDRVWRERGLRSAVLAGDEDAWRIWYNESFPRLYAYVAWRSCGMRDLTEEVVQETWLIAVRKMRRFKPEAGSFLTWLRGIAVNVLRNQIRYRKLRRARTVPLNGAQILSGQASSSLIDGHQAERISEALSRLPEHYEAVLRAKYLEQQSVAAIAENRNETPKAIESLLTRARAAFRDAYQQLE
jgi:RNA polymerase sigma-70 factor (ECF subfamily)